MNKISFVALIATLLPVTADAAPRNPRRLVFYAVSTTGGLPARQARERLRAHARDRLAGCPIPTRKTGSLPGSVRVTAELTKTGRLRITRFNVSGGHQPFETCLRQSVSRWKLSGDRAHAGSTVRFTFYVSFSPTVGLLGALAGKRGSSAIGTVGGGVVGVGGLGVRGSGSRYGSRYGNPYQSKAKITSVTVKGGLSHGVVTWAMKQMRLETNVRTCHRTEAKRRPNLSGRYELALRVGKNGSLDRIELVKSTVNDANLQSCVMRHLLRYSSYRPVTTFPTSSATTDVRMTIELPRPEKR